MVHDPFVRGEEIPDIKRDLRETLRGCHCACLVTAHSMYKNLDFRSLEVEMEKAILVDGRNALPTPPAGITVITLGRR